MTNDTGGHVCLAYCRSAYIWAQGRRGADNCSLLRKAIPHEWGQTTGSLPKAVDSLWFSFLWPNMTVLLDANKKIKVPIISKLPFKDRNEFPMNSIAISLMWTVFIICTVIHLYLGPSLDRLDSRSLNWGTYITPCPFVVLSTYI